MTVTVATDSPAELSADLLLVPLPSERSDEVLSELESHLGQAARRAADDFDGKAGESLRVYADVAAGRVVFIGTGDAVADEDEVTETLRQAAAAGAAEAQSLKAERVAVLLPHVFGDAKAAPAFSEFRAAQAMAEGFTLGSYRFTQYKTDDEKAPSISNLTFHVSSTDDADSVQQGATRGVHLADATCFARDLVNLSPNDKTAPLFADRIAASGEEHGYSVEIWDLERIQKEGFGGLLAVNLGSIEPPTFSVLEHKPDDATNEKPVVLVGKGVVFDTGGLSLKDTKGSMDLMKSDMAGAAAVVGAFEALADLDVQLHVIGLIPATDNRPGENAYVPGDVITMHSGTSVEVLNTDAEGRLLLADGLSYAKRFDPELVIDLATLTGAQVVALGGEAAAVMTSETDGSAEHLYAIQRAGERSGERVHPLPMYASYKKQLESSVADIKNVGGREAGCITAGKFLEHFVDYPWMHIDLAGPAFLSSAKSYRPVGGTGFGVRLLLSYLEQYATTRG
ncbi:leucyl aminopeptidase [Longibacter salinarum]|uniref:Probable cytosol aminopeptidase n=1 Tax=Longibacter salinarum TaxID=1850348 RepID=A0A2A8D0U3_9BACT|nr:leucyl aminopeptidase [Longibacter salinarum]PEN14423.1 leucyl aminopeptidase [Longibacter salinarum]